MDKVLLIDDDKAVNFFNKLVVVKHKHFEHITTVQSGKEGLSFLEQAERGEVPIPNIIFLDINMPAMNGWEFLDRFEQMSITFRSTIKVIILSSSSNPEHVKKSIESYDVVDFINKPLSFEILDRVFENHSSTQKQNA